MGRRKKVENMGVKELVQEHKRLLDQADAEYKKAREACADFYEDYVRPAMAAERNEKAAVREAMGKVPRDLVCKREQVQSKLNRAKSKRRELYKDLADARRMQVRGKEAKSIVAEWKAREDLVSREIKLLDAEVRSLDKEFSRLDREYRAALEEAMSGLASS